jgi:protein tyrosine kinase modulator
MNSVITKPSSDLGLAGLEYYGLKDYRRILERRKWLIVAVAFIVALAIAVGAFFWPDSFKADAVIVVDPGKVPQTYIHSTATIPAVERVALLQAQILSDTRLSQVIDEMGLYTKLKDKKTLDQILLKMREDIQVEPVSFANLKKAETFRSGLQAFTISYISNSPSTAARVSNRLASLFIDENMKARQDEVMGTAEFFDRELVKAQEDLKEKGKKMDQLRARFAAELPESENAHIQALASLQLELRSEMDAISRAQQQKVYLQSLLAQAPAVVDLDTAGGAGQSDAASPEQAQLARLQGELDQMRSRYGPGYPDVKKLEDEIQTMKAQMKPAQTTAKADPPAASAVHYHNPVVESQIAQLDQEMQKHAAREKELQSETAFHQSKLEAAPMVQQQLAAASRDYDNAEQNFKDVQARKFAADMSSDVEIRQKGERFVIVQPAQPPSRPYAPNRILIDGLGLPAGIAVALALVLLFELIDGSVKTEREVRDRVSVPIIGGISWLPTEYGSRRKRLQAVFAASGSSLLALAYVAVLMLAVK